jgi:hypothetical protein
MKMKKILIASSTLIVASLLLSGCTTPPDEDYSNPTINTKPTDGFVFKSMDAVTEIPLIVEMPEETNGWASETVVTSPAFNTIIYKNDNECTFSVASQAFPRASTGSGDFYASKERAYSIVFSDKGGDTLTNESMVQVEHSKGTTEFISGEYEPTEIFDADAPKGIKVLDGKYTTFIAVRSVGTEIKYEFDPNVSGEQDKEGSPELNSDTVITADFPSFPEVVIKYTCKSENYKTDDALKMIAQTKINFYPGTNE